MKELMINLHVQTFWLFFLDDKKADDAYAALKAGMETYREFGNDETNTVTFVADAGEHTVRLAHLNSCFISDCDGSRASILAREKWLRSLRDEVLPQGEKG